MSIGQRILLLVILPILALTGFSGWIVAEKWSTSVEMQSLMTGGRIIATLTDLVTNVQRERGRSGWRGRLQFAGAQAISSRGNARGHADSLNRRKGAGNAGGDADRTLVGGDADDRRIERSARLGVPARVKRRVEGQAMVGHLDARDLH